MAGPDLRQQGLSGWSRVWTAQRYGLAALVFLNFIPPAHGPTRYLFFSLLILAVLTLWRQGRPLWVRTPIDAPLLLLLAWILLTVPFSIDSAYSFKEWRKLGAHVLLFYWVMVVLREDEDRRAIRQVLLAVTAGTAMTAGYAIVEFFLHGGTWRDRVVRAGAVGSDYNWLSTYMVMAIPIVLAATRLLREPWIKALGVGATGLALAAEVLAYTRAGWLGLVAEASVAVWLSGRRWLLIGFAILMIGVGVGVIAVWDFGERGETTDVTDPWTLRARVDVWKLAAEDLLEHPIVGIGYGNYNFIKRYSGRPELEKAYGPHSMFVVIGLGSGLPALGFFSWLLITAFATLTRRLRSAGQPLEVAACIVPVGVALMLVGFVVRNLFDYMLIGGLANLFWILTAFGLYATQLGPAHHPGSIDISSGSVSLSAPESRMEMSPATQTAPRSRDR